MASRKKKPAKGKKKTTQSSDLRQLMSSLYPDLQTATICVPPVIINQVPYSRNAVAGQSVLVLQTPESDMNRSSPATAGPSPQSRRDADKENSIVELAMKPLLDVWRDCKLSECLEIFSSTADEVEGPSTDSAKAGGGCPADSSYGLLDNQQCTRVDSKNPSAQPSQHKALQNSPQETRSLPQKAQTPPQEGQSSPQKGQSSPQKGQPSTQEPRLVQPSSQKTQPSPQKAQLLPQEAQLSSQTAQPSPQNAQPSPQLSTPATLWNPDPNPSSAPKPVFASDVRDDFCQQFLLTNLQELGRSRSEVMFILSQLNFTNYLNQPSYAAAAKSLPRPAGLGSKYKEGDFDILLIHRHHGILIGEIKSVGMVQGQLNKPQAEADADVTKRVMKAVTQLDKSETVVKHLVQDIAPGVIVRKALILPFVDRARLLRLLTSDQVLSQAVCTCLGAADKAEAVTLCISSNQLSDPTCYWKVTQTNLSKLTAWWQDRVACSVDNTLTDVLYLDIVARFAGPATTMTIQSTTLPRLQIPTPGDAVSLVGDTLTRLVLSQQQLELLQRDPPRVYIKGPPGTGKTVMLVLMGLRWLLQGHDVYVLSRGIENLAVSELICHQLRTSVSLHAEETASSVVGNVQLLVVDLSTDLVQETKKLFAFTESLLKKGVTHHFIMDETRMGKGINFVPRWEVNPACWLLEKMFANHYFCMAGVFNYGLPPSVEQVVLTTPLRCAPPVQREIQPALDEWATSGKVQPFDSTGIPAPSDGVRVIRLSHQGADHKSLWPVDCQRCGVNIAGVLRQLGIAKPSTPNCATPLQNRDVFVLTRSSTLRDDVIDDAGNVTAAASGVVQGLRAEGFPVAVLGACMETEYKRRREQVSDVALARADRVTVAFSMFLQGLERKVVVWLPGQNHTVMEDVLDSSETLDRIHALSRCTTQLIVVDLLHLVEDDLD